MSSLSNFGRVQFQQSKKKKKLAVYCFFPFFITAFIVQFLCVCVFYYREIFFLSVSIRNRVMPSDRKWFPRFAIFYFFSFLFLGERNEAHGGGTMSMSLAPFLAPLCIMTHTICTTMLNSAHTKRAKKKEKTKRNENMHTGASETFAQQFVFIHSRTPIVVTLCFTRSFLSN